MHWSFPASVSPDTPLGRVVLFVLQPSWRRRRAVRRLFAVVLVVISMVMWFSRVTHTDPAIVVVAEAIRAGETIEEDQVTLTPVPPAFVPAGAFRQKSAVVGRIAATAFQPREIPVETRLVGMEAVNALHDPAWQSPTMVPIVLSADGVTGLLQHGDTVTVVTGVGASQPGTVIATAVRVLLAQQSPTANREGVAVVVADAPAAQAIAAANVEGPLGVLVTGPRAHGAPDVQSQATPKDQQ
ncbi:SAF domain-containing protein [Corynebacterium choanae]|uniref:SAF domain protein n=1 Tax=Corynebacterium choanae TaxID=1862358 RepID=A0A3G6J4Y3_9CORY|nr:SAF domain-containing protein [Corynebacterium choanae]AZA13087.1 SAF domain protein [Corynebacterium choanae]